MRASSLRLDIEGLRAIAILLVLAFHAGSFIPGGYVGVDVFFVISGFLITGLLLREQESSGTISLLQFYARRARRLLPAASLVLLTTCIVAFFAAALTDRATFAVDVASAAGYIANWRFAARAVDYLAEDVGRSPVLHFWSLSVEEQFYLIWPLLIVGALAVGRRLGIAGRATLLWAIQLVLLPSLAWSIWLTQSDAKQAFFVTGTRLWELGVGATLAILLPHAARLPAWVGSGCSWLGALGIGVSAALFDQNTSFPGYWAAIPTLGAALVILGGTATPGIVSRVLGTAPLVWLGGISYAVYLWHWPVLVAGQDWFGLSGRAAGIALTFASIGPAWLSHRLLENPIRFSSWLSARPQLALSLGGNLSLGVVAVAVLLAWAASGEAPGADRVTVALRSLGGRVSASPKHLGAGVLTARPRPPGAGEVLKRYEKVFPNPATARADLPRAYDEGCQMAATAVEVHWCEAGDKDAKRTLALIGDSKILQYHDALDAAGQALGFKIRSATMSSCASTDATISNDGKPYTRCSDINARILQQLEADPPVAVITSQHATRAYDGDELSRDAMVGGLASRWSKLRAKGIEVVVVLDNPRPPDKMVVYECMLEHADDQTKCAFARKKGIDQSAAGVQRDAAKLVPGVHLIDLAKLICPEQRCAPVIGDVLVYRQGSHITNTYARTLAPRLTEELERVLTGKP